MSAYYRNNGYEEDPEYSDSSRSRNYTQGYLKTRDYSDSPGPLNNSDYPSTRRNPYSEDSRTSPDYPGFLAEPDYPGSQSDPDYPRIRSNPYSEDSRRSSDYPKSLAEPDYIGSGSNPYRPGSSREPDYSESQRSPDFAGSRSSGNYARSRTNPDFLDPMGEPDYPGAQRNSHHPGLRANSNHPGSRGNSEYAGSRISPYRDSREQPDYPGAENEANSPNIFGEPDYPGAENNRNPSNFWGEPDYPDAEDGPDYGSSETPEMTREFLSRTSSIRPSFRHGDDGPLGILERENEGYPGSIEMNSMEMANPYGRSVPGAPGTGYVNPAFVGESSLGPAYGDPPLSGYDWHKSPEGQKLIASLIPMTSRDRIKAIRNQPRTMEEKRNLRTVVDREKSKQPRGLLELRCCARCLNSVSLAYRRSKNSLSELLNSVSPWQKTLKVIGGKFGTSVLSYFNFLRWLLKFNIFSFIVTFSFLIIPQLTMAEKNTLQFTGWELLTGAGYFRDTVMYYGFYTNSTIRHGPSGASYNMQLAYIFTIGACLIVCFFSLLFSMARYFRNNFINPHIYSRGIAKLIFCWDFTVTHEKAVKLRQKNLSTEIRENLSEIRQESIKLTLHQWLLRSSAYLAAWVVSTGVAVACCVAVYYLADNNLQFLKSHRNAGAVLLLPLVVSCINLAVPRFYSAFRLVEHYEVPRHEVYILLIRNIFLKISIIGILCYYWLNMVALAGEECWETFIGQEIYRLLLMDFVFSLADSFLGEFLRRIIGMRFFTSLGLQEFDIARNVLELIYAQTLVWIGTFFCPLLPFIQMIALFIMFYVKNISLIVNFQPASKAWRASQMMTVFIFLLFFPSFAGVLCIQAITIWRLKPSADCGPFRGLPLFIQAIYSWIDTLSKRPSYLWVVWIYRHLIGSVHFFFILTLIVLIITYLYWQITEGRKIMIRLLHEQIINEGKDKMFLIEKLIKLQDAERRASPSSFTQERRDVEVRPEAAWGSL
ncbi:PREDICTED: transmembrane channel-like protein 5 [Ceratotherium simum simum]|uniref:Transmembrane channel-like protein n=1 Tax=Ceratotherium simum simum TaxID=73337 RepID=A0ABM1DJ27_CERSS|nr:PREDICTED: transmembrane channel-like protein 5 [Ceratotherium simum simum]